MSSSASSRAWGSRARARAAAPGARGPGAHRADDGLSQRLRAPLYGRPRVRGPLGRQVHDLRGRQCARHQARDGVRRPRAAAPPRRPGAAAARALPRGAPAGRGSGGFLLPDRHRRIAQPRRRGARLMTQFYPAFLDLRGRRAVVIGGGAIAEQKVAGLLDAGARVTVISPSVSRRLEDLAAAGTLTIERRPYRPGDLAGAFLAIAATDDRAANRAVWTEAEARGVLLNAVDDLPHCSFIAPAIHRQGDVAVAVSTAGRSPALAVRLRERIGRLIGPEYATLLELLGELRAELARRVRDARIRTRLWYRIVDSDAIELVRRGDVAGARRRIGRLVEAAEEPATRGEGIVYIVGAGPGDPGLITRRGLERLRAAEVVVYDRLGHPDLLEEAPPRAERIFVGKRPRREGHSLPQEQINTLLIETARGGRVVVRLKGGDPFVFGRGAEECEALRAAGVAYEVVPGVTSAIAAPGAAGIPVTHRRHASAFAVVAGHECDAASDLDWDALARLPALVFLMGLRALPQITPRLIAPGMPEETPAAAIASATLPAQRTVIGTLATLAERAEAAGLEPPATLVVGDVVGSAPVAEQDRAAAGGRWFSPGPPGSFTARLDGRPQRSDRRGRNRQHIEHAVPRPPIRPQKAPVADLVRDPHRDHRREYRDRRRAEPRQHGREAGPDHGVEQPTAPRRRCRLVLVHRAPKMRRLAPGARETRYFRRVVHSLRNDPPPHAGQPIGTADGPR